ncbi:MAG: hypothetical protein EA376_05360 [Phycisphaeraceae bacterium]|nr:MAG: hypothetical protein EA376_05360 [Phycisphaeraceae bacterium]
MDASRFRTPLVGLALGAVFLMAGALAWIANMRVAAEPAPAWDAADRLGELVASRQPHGAVDAWPIYQRILHEALGIDDLLNPDGNELYAAFISHRRDDDPLRGDWNDPYWVSHRARLEELRPLFPLLDELAEAMGYSRPYLRPEEFGEGPAPGFTILLPEVSLMRQLARLNTVGMRAAAEAEDWGEVVRRFRTGRAIGRHLSFQATMIEWLVSAAVIALVHNEMIRIVMEHDIPAPVCEALLRAMAEIEWPGPAPEEMHEGERIAQHDLLQWVYEPGEDGRLVEWALWSFSGFTGVGVGANLDPASPPPLHWRLTNLSPRFLYTPTHGRTLREIDDLFDQYALLATPGADFHEFDSAAAIARIIRHPVLEYFMPALDRASNNLMISLTFQAALEAMLRLELRHAATGAWPATLEEAMTPAQATDPVTGDPFEYERIEDDADGRPYILRGPALYPLTVRLDHWPVLNNAREPIPEAWREIEP